MLPRLLVLFLALPAFAATTYEVARRHEGGTGTVTVLADGERARVDFTIDEDNATVYTSVLWFGGEHAIALNARNATWYVMQPDPLALRSRYLKPYEGKAKNVKWTMSESNGTYTARLTYDVTGGMARVRCSADYVIETTDAHPRALWPGRILASTGFPEVDAQLTAADASIARFPTRMTLTATRKYDGGPAMQDALTIETRNLRETSLDAKTFVRPAEYRKQDPVIAAPGVTSR